MRPVCASGSFPVAEAARTCPSCWVKLYVYVCARVWRAPWIEDVGNVGNVKNVTKVGKAGNNRNAFFSELQESQVVAAPYRKLVYPEKFGVGFVRPDSDD